MQRRSQGYTPKQREHSVSGHPPVVTGHRYHIYTQRDDRYIYIGKDEATREPMFLDYGRVVKPHKAPSNEGTQRQSYKPKQREPSLAVHPPTVLVGQSNYRSNYRGEYASIREPKFSDYGRPVKSHKSPSMGYSQSEGFAPKQRENSSAAQPPVVMGHRYHKYAQHDDRYKYIGKDDITREPLFLDYGRVVNPNASAAVGGSRVQTSWNQQLEPNSSSDDEVAGHGASYACGNVQEESDDEAGPTLVSGWEYAEDNDRYQYVGRDEDTGEPEFLDYGCDQIDSDNGNGQGQDSDTQDYHTSGYRTEFGNLFSLSSLSLKSFNHRNTVQLQLVEKMGTKRQRRRRGYGSKQREHSASAHPPVVTGHEHHIYAQRDDRYQYIGKDEETGEPLFLDRGRVVKSDNVPQGTSRGPNKGFNISKSDSHHVGKTEAIKRDSNLPVYKIGVVRTKRLPVSQIGVVNTKRLPVSQIGVVHTERIPVAQTNEPEQGISNRVKKALPVFKIGVVSSKRI